MRCVEESLSGDVLGGDSADLANGIIAMFTLLLRYDQPVLFRLRVLEFSLFPISRRDVVVFATRSFRGHLGAAGKATTTLNLKRAELGSRSSKLKM
jgi:hypothetical protein